MRFIVKTRGFKELARALAEELPRATAKNVLKRSAVNAMAQLEARAKQLAPKDDGTLAARIATKSVRAKRISRTRFASQSGVSVATGPTSKRGADSAGGVGAWQEFGTVKMAANPFMRPAADSELEGVLDIVRAELAAQIDKAKGRIARKAARG